MIFRKATQPELPAVFSLYQSVVGSPFCVWDEAYPGWEDIREDFEHGTLYVMAEGDELLGAISVIVHNEMDQLPFWQQAQARELARVVVAPGHQGRGIAQRMVTELSGVLQAQGIPAIHLLVAHANPPAQQVYRRCGFQFLGSCFMFGHDYYGCEKNL